jgi:hypothetical protein
MWLRKHLGGTAVGPYEWKNDGDVTEVPDRLGEDLLRLDPHGYEAAEAPKPAPAPKAAAKAPEPAKT